MTNQNMINKAKEIISTMDKDIKDTVYRLLWVDYVKQDVVDRIDDTDPFNDTKNMAYMLKKVGYENLHNEAIENKIIDEMQEYVAERYCFEGDYDCNQDYWSNIDSLIDDFFKLALDSVDIEV